MRVCVCVWGGGGVRWLLVVESDQVGGWLVMGGRRRVTRWVGGWQVNGGWLKENDLAEGWWVGGRSYRRAYRYPGQVCRATPTLTPTPVGPPLPL